MASHDPLQGFREDSRKTHARKKTVRWVLSFALQAGFLGLVWLLAPALPPTLQLIILAGLMALFGLSGPWLIWLITEDFRRKDLDAFGWRSALSGAICVIFSASMLFMAAATAYPLWPR